MKVKALLAVFIVIVVANDQGYHSLVGIPVAERIRIAEANTTRNTDPEKLSTELTAHNYLVGVLIRLNHSLSICGSSLLSNTRALTAAHCWWDGWRRAQEFTLVFGSEYIFVGGTRIKTKKVVMHDQWDPMSLDNDLAMIMFDHVAYSQYVHPIALPTDFHSIDFIGSTVGASGYGIAMPDNSGYSPAQKQTFLITVVVPTEHCFHSMSNVLQKTLCTRSKERICISHAGGPLMAEFNDDRVLIGVSSFGDYSCTHNQDTLAGYVRVSFYLQWIYSNLDLSVPSPSF